jgi:hypothetical protein
VTHGSRGAYQRGCRCQPCADANNTYAAKQRASKRTLTPNGWKIPAAVKNQHGLGIDDTGADIHATWRQQAICRLFDPSMWDIDNPDQWDTAAAICNRCPVRQQCRQDHDNNPDAFGLYAAVPLWAGQPLQRKTA